MDSILSIYWTNTRLGAKLFSSRRRGSPLFPLAGGRTMPARLSLPLALRRQDKNCSQEAGGAPSRQTVNIRLMESAVSSPRLNSRSIPLGGWLLPLILLAAQWLVVRTFVQAAVVVTPRITLVVIPEKHMPEDEWSALSTALRQSFEALALETHLGSGGFDVVRVDILAPGVQFDEVIPIYLHGNCRILAEPGKYIVAGALGWVLRDRGQILPYIHVDCGRIAEMLGQHALAMNNATRNAVMAEAISRVVMHEWLHIATQRASHSREGLSKDAFSFKDLVPDYAQILAPAGNGK